MKNILIVFLLVSSMLDLVVQPTTAKEKEKDFISLAYVSLSLLNMHKMQASEVKDLLDRYNWRGISDVALIGGIFMTGQDASIMVSWEKKSWPVVYEGVDYKGDPIDEQRQRDMLCSKKVVREVIKYFKKKKIDIWLCQTAYGWLTDGSLGVVLEDHEKTLLYAQRLNHFARELRCIGLDFDWEFPPTARQAQGYRELMQESKRLGMKVSVCAIQPTVDKAYQDNCFPDNAGINNHEGKFMKWEEIIGKEMVDHINVM